MDVDDPDICAGAATIGCEILEQLPRADVILIPVGDSNLIRGVAFAAKHLKESVKIVGVQAEGAPAYYLSWKEGRAVQTETADTIADGLATRTTTDANVRGLRELVDDMRVVTDEEMIRGVAGCCSTNMWLRSLRERRRPRHCLLVGGNSRGKSWCCWLPERMCRGRFCVGRFWKSRVWDYRRGAEIAERKKGICNTTS